MSYRKPFEEALDSMQNDIETVKDELENILDMEDIEDMKIAISETLQTINTMLGGF